MAGRSIAAAGTRPPASSAPAPWRLAVLASAGIIAAAVLALVAFGAVEQFLVSDARFRLAGPAMYGEESPSLRVEGVTHAPRERILRVFQRDFGRSLYLLPAAERRRNLLAIDWVRDASVARIWPNRVAVRIAERVPVAFVQLASPPAGASRVALIDEDGVILEPHGPARFRLPVVTGIRRDQSEAARREAVQRMLHLLREVGPLGTRISEIDVGDPDNLKLIEQVDDRALVLLLGNRRFRPRLENFLSHYAEIRKRLPGATTLDLRIDDRIIVVEEAAGGR